MICTNSPVLPRGQKFRTTTTSVFLASNPLFATFLTTCRAPFCVSSVSTHSRVADCCSCSDVAAKGVADFLGAFSKLGCARSSVPMCLLKRKSQSSRSLPGPYTALALHLSSPLDAVLIPTFSLFSWLQPQPHSSPRSLIAVSSLPAAC